MLNVLFITLDQWRAECLSVLGHPLLKTPNIDQLAKEGTLFLNHYAQATPCAPSRSSLHTGMYMHNHGCVSNYTPLQNRFTNWALECRKSGYRPALFGYTDSPKDPENLDPDDSRLTHTSEPLNGIDSYSHYQFDVPVEWVSDLREKGYSIPEHLWDLYGTTRQGAEWEDAGAYPLPLAITAEDHETHFMVDQCIEWINQQNSGWMSHLSLFRPHPPFVAPDPYNRLYPPELITTATCTSQNQIDCESHPFLQLMRSKRKFQSPSDREEIQRMWSSYFGLLTELDDNLGRLFCFLRQTDQWDNTLIILTSDHGEQLGEHGLISKLGFFDASYHVPLIIRDPSCRADPGRDKKLKLFTENVDIMPTLLHRLGLPIPGQCDGISLMDCIRSGKSPANWRSAVHFSYDFRHEIDDSIKHRLGITDHQCNLSVLRDSNFKYVHFTSLPPLLFDLKRDPGEMRNLAAEPSYREIQLEYCQQLLSWRMNHNERGLTNVMLTPEGARYSNSPLTNAH